MTIKVRNKTFHALPVETEKVVREILTIPTDAETITGDKTFSGTTTHTGNVVMSGTGKVDLNGVTGALIFDADGDTTMAASVDNRIDITVAGATDFQISANEFNLVSGSHISCPDGTVSDLPVRFGADGNNGVYGVSDTVLGFAVEGSQVATMSATGITGDSLRLISATGIPGTGVTATHYGDGLDITTVLTLSNFVVGALAGAGAALGVGNIVYSYPAGQHFEIVSAFSALSLTAAGTAVATDTGLGSVIATGAIATLDGTATFEDRLTGQTINTASGGGAAVSTIKAATAGIGTGISLNLAASVKNVFLNSAGTWNADNTGNLTASGTIVLKWTKMS